MWVEVLSSTEKARRYEFLNNYLKFFVGHWGNYWHMETHPHAGIELTKDLDSAFVRFRLGYQGGTALVVNTDEGWDLIHSELTWIE